MEGLPDTRYAWADDLSIAYQRAGSGPPYLVMVPGTISHVETLHDFPGYTDFLHLLSEFCCAVPFDKRGYGLSDRLASVPMLEDRMGDIAAVSSEVGADRITLYGWSEGGPIAALYAATYPDLVDGLVLFDSFHKFSQSPGETTGVTTRTLEWMKGPMVDEWGSGVSMQMFRPDDLDKPEVVEVWSRMERNTMSPSALKASWEWIADIDIRDILPTVKVPTLLLNRADSFWSEQMSEIAEMIPDARHFEFPGRDHTPWGHSDDGEIASVIREFITGEHAPAPTSERSLATVLFTDIVDSTASAAELGDRRWRELLDAHDQLVARQARRFRGQVIKSTGDGVLVIFDGPGRAVDCALVVSAAVEALGLTIRAGLHTGEIERRGEDISGMAVNLASRVESLAEPGQVLVSRTVTDLVVGSHHQFTSAGRHSLKGVPGDWDLFAASQ